MNTDLIRSLVGPVEAEAQNRKNARSSMSPEAAYYRATFYDTPFVNELYLLVLLFIWHKVEKEIVHIAALSSVQDDSPISRDSRDDYRKEVNRLAQLGHEKRKKELEKLLPLDQREWALLDVLRLLANSYKHDPFYKPSSALLKLLGLPKKVSYAPLPASGADLRNDSGAGRNHVSYAPLSASGAVRFGLSKFLDVGDEPRSPRSYMPSASPAIKSYSDWRCGTRPGPSNPSGYL